MDIVRVGGVMQDCIQAEKRPGWVWAIFILYSFSAALTLLSLILVYSGAISIPLKPEQHAYLSQLTYFDIGTIVLVATLKMSGAVALFLLRGMAFELFFAGFALGLLKTVWHALEKDFLAAAGSSGMVATLFGWAMAIAICAYAWRLRKAGVLR